jgi:hypothetical protein
VRVGNDGGLGGQLSVMSDALGRRRSSDNVRCAAGSDGIGAPPRSAALGHRYCSIRDQNRARGLFSSHWNKREFVIH